LRQAAIWVGCTPWRDPSSVSVRPTELDVHDLLNTFQVVGLMDQSNRCFFKSSPAKKRVISSSLPKSIFCVLFRPLSKAIWQFLRIPTIVNTWSGRS
jgi:hypothetical protein